jgi:hypothetical protein
MIGRQERLFAVQDRRVGTGGVIEAIDLARSERELDVAQQSRVRVGLEVWINEVGDRAGLTVQLDSVGRCSRVRRGRGVHRLSTSRSLCRSYRDDCLHKADRVFAPARISDLGGFLSPAIDRQS